MVWPYLKVFWFSTDASTGHIIVKGKRRGSQKKRWEDNINEWTGTGLTSSVRKAKKEDKVERCLNNLKKL